MDSGYKHKAWIHSRTNNQKPEKLKLFINFNDFGYFIFVFVKSRTNKLHIERGQKREMGGGSSIIRIHQAKPKKCNITKILRRAS